MNNVSHKNLSLDKLRELLQEAVNDKLMVHYERCGLTCECQKEIDEIEGYINAIDKNELCVEGYS